MLLSTSPLDMTQMTRMKRFQWVTTFLLLTLFSVLSLQHVTSAEGEKAYAKVISSNSNVFKGNKYVVTNNADEIKKKVLARLIDRFTGLINKHQDLCNVTPDQFNLLSKKYGATLQNVNVGNETASVIRLDKSDISTNELRRVLGNNENVHCRLVDVYSDLILILTANLS